MSERLFENRKEWYKHETQYHRLDWSCNTYGHPEFLNQSHFMQHMSASHGAHLDEKKMVTLRAMFQKPSKKRSGECNLCGVFSERLETHVAHHLQQISLFALPRVNDTQGSGDAEFDTQSSRVRGDKQEESHEVSWKSQSGSPSSRSGGGTLIISEATQATRDRREQMLELLLNDEVASIDKSLLGPMLEAINATKQFLLLDQLKAKLSSIEDFDSTVFLCASVAGYARVTRFLLRSGRANVNSTDSSGVTPLMMAAQAGNLAILETLISEGADVHFRNEWNLTAIMMAREAGCESAVRLLLEHGAVIEPSEDVNDSILKSEPEPKQGISASSSKVRIYYSGKKGHANSNRLMIVWFRGIIDTRERPTSHTKHATP